MRLYRIEQAPFREHRKVIVGVASTREQARVLVDHVAKRRHRSVIHYRIVLPRRRR